LSVRFEKENRISALEAFNKHLSKLDKRYHQSGGPIESIKRKEIFFKNLNG
jgi:hypothetical protein